MNSKKPQQRKSKTVSITVELPEAVAHRAQELADIHFSGSAPRFIYDLIEREVDHPSWARRHSEQTKKGHK